MVLPKTPRAPKEEGGGRVRPAWVWPLPHSEVPAA